MITVLVIVADGIVRLTIERVLERAGCTVIAVPDQTTALDRLASLKADIAICDIGEHRKGGPTLSDIGRIDPDMPMLVIACKDLIRETQIRTGDMLGKPFTASELLSAVRRSLARRCSLG